MQCFIELEKGQFIKHNSTLCQIRLYLICFTIYREDKLSHTFRKYLKQETELNTMLRDIRIINKSDNDSELFTMEKRVLKNLIAYFQSFGGGCVSFIRPADPSSREKRGFYGQYRARFGIKIKPIN